MQETVSAASTAQGSYEHTSESSTDPAVERSLAEDSRFVDAEVLEKFLQMMDKGKCETNPVR